MLDKGGGGGTVRVGWLEGTCVGTVGLTVRVAVVAVRGTGKHLNPSI